MSGLRAFSSNSSDLYEELSDYYLKLNSGKPTKDSRLFQILNNQFLNKSAEIILEKIATYYKENKKTGNALNIYKKLSLNSDRYLGKFIECALLEGELFLAEIAAKKYLNYLQRKKNFKIANPLIEELKKHGLGKEFIDDYVLIFSALSGDKKTFLDKISGFNFDIFDGSNYKLIIAILNAISGREYLWNDLAQVKKIKLYKLFYQIKDVDSNNLSLRQEFINLLFEFKCFFPEDNFSLILLSQYARLLKVSPLINVVNDYLENNKKRMTKEEYLKSIKRDDSLVDGLTDVSQKTSLKGNREGLSHFSKRLIYFSQLKEKDKNFYINERCLIKVCELLEDNTITEFYEDLVVCFLMMDFFEVAHSILDRIDKNKDRLGHKEKINLEFLRINIFLGQKRYWEVLQKVDDLFLSFPLVPEEIKTFSYLRAEANYLSGRKTEAKKAYLEIQKKSPGYRLVENRLLEIETIK